MTFFTATLQNIDNKSFRRIILFFFILSFIIYSKSIPNKYSMDDDFIMVNNVQIHKGIKAIPEIFKTTYALPGQKGGYEYRPVVKATYAIEYQIFGENPHISHFINILIYALSASFLFFLLLKLLPGYHYLFAFVVALIFLLHPLHSEVVISLKNRDGLLSFIGCLLSLYYCLKYAENNKTVNLFIGAFFMLFAMLSKRDAMSFYLIIPFTIWFFRSVSWKKLVIIFLSIASTYIIFGLLLKNVASDVSRKVLNWENPLFFDTTMIDRIPQGFYSLYFYVKMFLIPHPLIFYYGYNQVPIVDWSHPIVWIVLAAVIITGYYIIKNLPSRALWIYGVLYFLITIAMFTNVVEPVVGIVGERFAYIPSVGLSILFTYIIFKLLKIPYDKIHLKINSINNTLWIFVVIIILTFGIKTYSRNEAWKDNYTLYKTDIKYATESAHAHSLLAIADVQKARQNPNMSEEERRKYADEAVEHYKEALRILPSYAVSINNLGMVYFSYYHQPDVAMPYFKRAISLDSNYVEAYFNLASSYDALGNYKEAEKFYLKTISLDPYFLGTYFSLSKMYSDNKEFDKVLKLNKDAINKGIKSDIMYINIGNVYFSSGDTLAALPYLEQGIYYNNDNKVLNSFLSDYYRQRGDIKKSDYYYSLMVKSSE